MLKDEYRSKKIEKQKEKLEKLVSQDGSKQEQENINK